MTDSSEQNTPRTPPTGGAWLDEKRRVADRNEETQKAGKAERAEKEKGQRDARRLSEQNGVYR